MIAVRQAASKSASPPMLSIEATAQHLGVDLAAEPELMHIVSKMRTTRLPPTWAAVDTTISDKKTSRLSCNSHDASANSRNNWGGIDNTLEHSEKEMTASTRLEYVNCVTGERTPRHPGMSYFLAEVESERSKNKRSQEVIVLSAASTEGISSGGSSGGSSDNHNSNNMDHSSSIIGGGIDLTLQSPSVRHPQPAGTHVGEGSGDVANIDTREDNTMDDDHSVSNNFSSALCAVRRKKPGQVVETGVLSNSAGRNGTDIAIGHTTRKLSSAKGICGKRRMPPPKWLVFTSWWHETISGVENRMNRKHASIRYATADASFEVELEDVPAIFEVSHATGRHGTIATIDIRVGAQIQILGRQMCLMQCDGLTAQWLESEVRAITKAKAALVSALEEGGDRVRVTCRSDRLEASASAQRGSGSVGQAARMDRRALMQDVTSLRDLLERTKPDEAMRLTEGLISS
ncbi:unnamed protein product [Pylaiella littoralis]